MEYHEYFEKLAIVPFAILLGCLIGACGKDLEPESGFVLLNGDIERSKQVFSSAACRHCPSLKESDLPQFGTEPVFDIRFGDKVLKVRTYGELFSAIVIPERTVLKIHRAKLPEEARKQRHPRVRDFNASLNITQSIDLSEFLQPHCAGDLHECRDNRYAS